MIRYLINLFSLIILFSCTQNKQGEEISEVILKNDETILEDENRQLDKYISNIDTFQTELSEITIRQKALLKKIKEQPELLKKKDTSIINEINELRKLINQNNTEILSFNESQDSIIKNKNIIKLMNLASENILIKNDNVNKLQDQFEAFDLVFDDLFEAFGDALAELDYTKTSLDETKEYLKTIWYIVDSKKNLTEKGIIGHEGGFIGIKKNEAISSDLNLKYFSKGNKLDISEIEIPNGYKKIDLITSHPLNTYLIKEDRILILDREEFWQASKYLVVSLK